MKKRLLSAILSFCMLLTMVPTVAFAAEPETSDTVTWALTQNNEDTENPTYTLTISGSGNMEDYTQPTKPAEAGANIAPWYTQLAGSADSENKTVPITEIVVTDGVTGIGNWAFAYTQVKTATFNDSVKQYGIQIYSNCPELTTVDWNGFAPKSVMLNATDTEFFNGCAIPGHLFTADRKLNICIIGDTAYTGKLVVPDTVTAVGTSGFYGTDFKTVDFKNDLPQVKQIGYYSFANMQSLKSLTIPGYMQFVLGGTDRILSNAFSEEFNATSMVVEEGVETIPAAMARSWTSMQTLKLPSTITSIGANAFSTAKQLHSVDMSKITGALTVKTVFNTWGQGDPVDCIFYVNNSSIRDTLNADNWGSRKAKKIFAVTNGGIFPEDVAFTAGELATPVKEGYIFDGWYADSSFSGTAVTTPTAGQTYYAKWAPASGTCGAAGNEDNVTWKLTANADDPSTYTLTISGTGDMANLVTLRGDLTVDQNNQPWASAAHQITKLVLKEGITSIGDGAFYDMPLLKSADIPASVTKIGVRAFNWAATMDSLTFAKGSKLKEIGYAAFNKIAISDVTIPASVEKIDKQAFGNDSNLTTVLFEQGSALKEIGETAFFKCGKLTKLILPEGLTTIGNRAFNNENTSLTTVVIPSTVTSFGEEIYNTQNGCLYFANSEVYSHYTKPQIIKYCMAVMNDGMFTSDTVFTAGTLSTPAKSGYKFIDWYSDAELNNPATTFEAGNTYYAKWTEKTTPAIAIKATPDTLTGGGSVTLTVTGVPSEGTVEVTCDNGISVTATETAGKYTAQLPNATKDYTFTAKYTGTDNYNDVEKSCIVKVTRKSSGGSSSGSSTPTNTVSASTASNGKVALDKSTAKKGDTVTVTVTPDAGYQLDKLTVTDAKGNTIAVAKKGDNQYTFTMPDSKVTITPTFSKIEDTKPSKTGFNDVASSAWYADAVQYVTDKGLMNGTDDNQFSPSASTTRGMLMTVLARYAGEDTTGGATWYEKGMNWAKAKGVSDGTNPNANITREQLVTMMYRYAGSPATNGSLDNFSDAASVSSYAVNAIQWAVANGIVNGSNGKLNPQNNATRAQVAAILMRFCEMSK